MNGRGIENYGEAAAKQANFENRKQREQEPRKRKHRKEEREFPDVDTFQRYLQEEGSDE